MASLRKSKNPLRERLGSEFFASIPDLPGVYFMRNAMGKVVYVGKAKSLRKRLRSYCTAKQGSVGRNILRLIEEVARIDWETHVSEPAAFTRELELIRALLPRYNIADKRREKYFFIGYRGPSEGRLDLRLTDDQDEAADYKLHGCYPRRRAIKEGYAALLRLLYAASFVGERFQFPARLARSSPAYDFTLKLAEARRWTQLLSKFLHGQTSGLLAALFDSLLENDRIPAYVRPGLQRDLLALRDFDEACRAFRERSGLPCGLLSHRELRRLIRHSIEARP